MKKYKEYIINFWHGKNRILKKELYGSITKISSLKWNGVYKIEIPHDIMCNLATVWIRAIDKKNYNEIMTDIPYVDSKKSAFYVRTLDNKNTPKRYKNMMFILKIITS